MATILIGISLILCFFVWKCVRRLEELIDVGGELSVELRACRECCGEIAGILEEIEENTAEYYEEEEEEDENDAEI